MADYQAVLIVVGSSIGGAATAATTLYFTFRSKLRELRKAESEDNKQTQIDTEAEWKRIIDMYAVSHTKQAEHLQDLDVKYKDLLTRFIESEKERAAKIERIRSLDERLIRLTDLLTQRCPACPFLPNSNPEILRNSIPTRRELTTTLAEPSSPDIRLPDTHSESSTQKPSS